ncbi:peptide-methionine (R)-S-oxide reductase, partial [Salmonella enterica subsp. enterica serovar Enteritidis]|nr:peptide-methionine (R)-S-oxide reductase [Salmonella enterica subsp. enterica serovar Enteritidis]
MSTFKVRCEQMANQPSAEELKKKLSEMQFYVTQD